MDVVFCMKQIGIWFICCLNKKMYTIPNLLCSQTKLQPMLTYPSLKEPNTIKQVIFRFILLEQIEYLKFAL